MIRVTVDLYSAISRTRSHTLARVTIGNDLTGGPTRGNYVVRAQTGRRMRTARVVGFPRRSRSGLELLRRALNALAKEGRL